MKRSQLEHIIRAAGAITNHKDIIVVGSQSVLAQFPEAHPDLLFSAEADVFPKDRSDLAIQIDGAIGELSPFHQTFGYYAHGVDESTACLPGGWLDRLVAIHNDNTGGITGWCLDVHDLAASKLFAAREKDLNFVRLLLSERMISLDTLRVRCEALPISESQKDQVRNVLHDLKDAR